MDSNYYIEKLDHLIDDMIKNIVENNGIDYTKDMLFKLLDEEAIDLENVVFNDYSKEAIRLTIQKKILLSLESYAIQSRQSYWLAVKDKKIESKQFSNFSNYYLNDLKNGTHLFQTDTIGDIINYYNKMIARYIKIDSITKIKLEDEIDVPSTLNEKIIVDYSSIDNNKVPKDIKFESKSYLSNNDIKKKEIDMAIKNMFIEKNSPKRLLNVKMPSNETIVLANKVSSLVNDVVNIEEIEILKNEDIFPSTDIPINDVDINVKG